MKIGSKTLKVAQSFSRGERVLVHGGAFVISAVSTQNADLVNGWGADEVVDSNARFEEKLGHVDVVLDTVGSETLERSWTLLKPGWISFLH